MPTLFAPFIRSLPHGTAATPASSRPSPAGFPTLGNLVFVPATTVGQLAEIAIDARRRSAP